MKNIQVSEFKAKFSDIIKHIQDDKEEYVIQYGRKHKKVAVIVPYDQYIQNAPKIKLGLLEGKGKFEIKNDFEMDDSEFLSL